MAPLIEVAQKQRRTRHFMGSSMSRNRGTESGSSASITHSQRTWSMLLLLLSLSLFLQPTLSQELCDPTGPNPTLEGFLDIESLQAAIDTEREAIDAGDKEPESSYLFVLCPDTNFVIPEDEPLLPRLNNAQFACGLPPRLSNNCVFSGNDIQVFLLGFQDVTDLSFTGVRFTDFSAAAISGRATDVTRVLLINSAISDFTDATSIITQQPATGTDDKPFTVELRTVDIENGSGTIGFVNEQGSLLFDDVEFVNTNFTSSLISAAGNTGTVLIQGTKVSDSDIPTVIELQAGADLSVDGLDVTDMLQIRSVVEATGDGTTAILTNMLVENNPFDNPDPDNNPSEYLEASSGAFVNVSDSEFLANQNVQFGFHANTGGSMDIRDITANNNAGALLTGTETFASMILFANEGSQIRIYDSELSETDQITAAMIASEQSNIESRRTCLDSLDTETLVFAQFDSTISVAENNAIENSPSNVLVCPEGGPRLAQESTATSACFIEPDNCEVTCETFATIATCAEIPERSATDLPTPSPTSTPTQSARPTALVPTTVTSLPTLSVAPSTSNAPSDPPPTDRPTAAQSSEPTVQPSFSLIPTSTPSDTPSSRPTVSAAPTVSEMPSNIPTATAQPSVPPSTGVPTTLQMTSVPTRARTTAPSVRAPTPVPTIRCKPRPSKGKGKGKGKGLYGNTNNNNNNNPYGPYYGNMNGKGVLLPTSDDDVPYCDQLVDFGFYSKGKGKGTSNNYPPMIWNKGGGGNRQRNLWQERQQPYAQYAGRARSNQSMAADRQRHVTKTSSTTTTRTMKHATRPQFHIRKAPTNRNLWKTPSARQRMAGSYQRDEPKREEENDHKLSPVLAR